MTHPGAPSPPSPGPMNARAALLVRRERAAGSGVQAVRVLLSRPAVWMRWDVCSRAASYNEGRVLNEHVSFVLSLVSAVLAPCGRLTGGFFVWHVIQTRGWGVFLFHVCYQEKEKWEKGLSFMSCFLWTWLYHRLGSAGHKRLRAAGGFMRLLLAVEWQALKERAEQWLWSFIVLFGSSSVTDCLYVVQYRQCTQFYFVTRVVTLL